MNDEVEKVSMNGKFPQIGENSGEMSNARYRTRKMSRVLIENSVTTLITPVIPPAVLPGSDEHNNCVLRLSFEPSRQCQT